MIKNSPLKWARLDVFTERYTQWALEDGAAGWSGITAKC